MGMDNLQPGLKGRKNLFITWVLLIVICFCSIAFLTFGFDKSKAKFSSKLGQKNRAVTTAVLARTKTYQPQVATLEEKSTEQFSSTTHTKKETDTSENTAIPGNRRMPVVLIWKRPFGKMGPPANVHCGCRYTHDQKELAKSDAVVVHCRESDQSDLPPDFPNRTSSQIYIWWCMEPPIHVARWNLNMTYREGFFNWTMTYRRDSDVSTPWDFVENIKSAHRKTNMTLREILKHKNKTAISVVGNCGNGGRSWPSERKRLEIIKRMQQLMPIDGYGRCFNHRVEDIFGILKFYKFYLAFENSYHCKDYISEKFWAKPMRFGLVPVVWGATAEDYKAVAPRHSYIFAEHFNDTDELVKYLQYLDKNDTAYLEYLTWRSPVNLANVTFAELVPPMSRDFGNLCVLCRRLIERDKTHNKSTSEVKSVKQFFMDSNEESCLHQSYEDSLWQHQT